MTAPARPRGAWAGPARAAFSGAHRLAAVVVGAGFALRRRRLVTSLRLRALWHRARLRLEVAGDVRLGRRVRVTVEPHAEAAVVVGRACKIGDDVLIALRHGGRIELGAGVDIRRGCRLGTGGLLRIDGPTLVQDGCTIHCDEQVHIAEHIALAEYATVVDSSHYHDETGRWFVHNVATRPVTIEHDAWIGAKATVARGVVVGAGAVVSANSLVLRDVPPGALASGVPASIVGEAPWRPAPSLQAVPGGVQPAAGTAARSASSSS